MVDVLLWGQALGLLAMAIECGSSQFKAPRRIMLGHALSSVFWITHHAALGAVPAVVIASVAFLRNFFGVYVAEHYKRHFMAFIFSCMLAGTCLFVNILEAINWLPFLGASMMVGAVYWRDHSLFYRLCMISCNSFWVVFYLHEGSIAGVLTCMGNMFLVLITLYRYELPARYKLWAPKTKVVPTY